MEDEKKINSEDNKEDAKQESKQDIKQEDTKKEDVKETKKEETQEQKQEEKIEEKRDSKESDDYSSLKSQLKALADEINSQKIENTILKKIDNKDLQKAVLETGLVKTVEDIDKVLKIVELSKVQNKNRFSDGYVPSDEKQSDTYQQAEKKGDVLSMIKQKLSKQN